MKNFATKFTTTMLFTLTFSQAQCMKQQQRLKFYTKDHKGSYISVREPDGFYEGRQQHTIEAEKNGIKVKFLVDLNSDSPIAVNSELTKIAITTSSIGQHSYYRKVSVLDLYASEHALRTFDIPEIRHHTICHLEFVNNDTALKCKFDLGGEIIIPLDVDHAE